MSVLEEKWRNAYFNIKKQLDKSKETVRLVRVENIKLMTKICRLQDEILERDLLEHSRKMKLEEDLLLEI